MRILLIAITLLAITGCQDEAKTAQQSIQASSTPESGSLVEHVETLRIVKDPTPTP